MEVMPDRVRIDRNLQDFDTAWKFHERENRCDGLGGWEYERVLSEWYEANRPDPFLFIHSACSELGAS
jgi:hypothetical protein